MKYLAAIFCFSFTFCLPASHAQTKRANTKEKTVEQVIGLVKQYCGNCHNVPNPALLPKKSWPAVVQSMADLAARRMGREFISAEYVRDITAFYYGSSPETLPTLPIHNELNTALPFRNLAIGQKSKMPLIINIKSVTLYGNGSEFLVCDGGRNEVLLLTNTKQGWQETTLAKVTLPSHTEVIDFDLDGDKDILVTALGLFPPTESLAGKVLLLRQSAKGKFEKEVLLENVGRVADARAVDLDNDGDLDIAVAVFGGGIIGELSWLENIGGGKFSKHLLLNISGALNISPADLNADGKIDLVSLISQEHEMIVALINHGKGQFKSQRLSKAPHPMFGSTSMRTVDLDGDNDIDILATNGDALDLQQDPKPYHGVQWFENTGDLKFRYHNISRFYGAAIAIPGDLDADGDLDIVAGSWNNYWDNPKRQSMIWFENDGKQNFTRHGLINKPQSIVTIELEDINKDKRPDIIAGVFRIDLLKKILSAPKNKQTREENVLAKESIKTRLIVLESNLSRNKTP